MVRNQRVVLHTRSIKIKNTLLATEMVEMCFAIFLKIIVIN